MSKNCLKLWLVYQIINSSIFWLIIEKEIILNNLLIKKSFINWIKIYVYIYNKNFLYFIILNQLNLW